MNSGIRKSGWRRRAATIVETAVMAPLILAGTFGIMEVGYVFMARQTVVLSAREGARAGALPGATSNDAQARVNATMQGFGLSGDTTTVNMGTGADPTVTVTVSIPFNRCSITGNFFGGGSFNITSSASMRKEGSLTQPAAAE